MHLVQTIWFTKKIMNNKFNWKGIMQEHKNTYQEHQIIKIKISLIYLKKITTVHSILRQSLNYQV
jgi:hypothetical protein